MPTVFKLLDGEIGESGEQNSGQIELLIHDGNDSGLEAIVETAKAFAPDTLLGCTNKRVRCTPLSDTLWKATVSYSPKQKKEPGSSTYQFEIGGQTGKIFQALEHLRKYPDSNVVPDFDGAINVTKDSVDGVDVYLPTYAFSETHQVAANLVTGAYKSKLFHACATTNNAAWKGWEEGEALFIGASGSLRTAECWEITFRFLASPNVDDIEVSFLSGDETIVKGGWEYLWFRYQEVDDDTTKWTVRKPLSAYVERVYRKSNFAELGLGS